MVTEYDNLRPIFLRQQTTLDTLKSLALLQQSRSNRSFWYVLVADQQSYFSPAQVFTTTNLPARTNLVATILDRSRTVSAESSAPPAWTNISPAKPGLMAEVCIPEDHEGARRVLSQIVNELKQQRLFSKVDLLSDDLRRNLAEPRVMVPDRHYVLALDFAETQFQQPLVLKKTPGARSPHSTAKGPAHAARIGPATEGKLDQTGP